jgi:carbon storage regulator
MLVLSRKKDEKIIIGDDIEITIVDIRGDTVKVGVSAPKEVKIFRGELLEAIRQANIEAASQPAPDLEELGKKLKRRDKKSADEGTEKR